MLFDLCEPVLLLTTITVTILSASPRALRALGVPAEREQAHSPTHALARSLPRPLAGEDRDPADAGGQAKPRSSQLPAAVRAFVAVRRHRRELMAVGFAGALAFNMTNKTLMSIGVFPYAMIWSLVIFLPPGSIDRYLGLLAARAGRACAPPGLAPAPASPPGPGARTAPGPAGLRRVFGPVFVCAFVGFHVLWPIRGQLLMPPHVSWHEEGHIGAWNMKLRTKVGSAAYSFYVRDTTTPPDPSGPSSGGGGGDVMALTYSLSRALPGMGDPTLGGMLSSKAQKLRGNFVYRPYDAAAYLRYMRVRRPPARPCARPARPRAAGAGWSAGAGD